MKEIKSKLILLANRFDKRGLKKEADVLDSLIRKSGKMKCKSATDDNDDYIDGTCADNDGDCSLPVTTKCECGAPLCAKHGKGDEPQCSRCRNEEEEEGAEKAWWHGE